MNLIEQNAILYYADFLRLREESRTVTDNCKYYFIYKTPVNSAYLVDEEPFYDVQNKYYVQAYNEYELVKNKFGEDGVDNFVSNICNLQAAGCVNAEQMLKCIHQFSTKQERNKAVQSYKDWVKSLEYQHIMHNEEGDNIIEPCTKYVAHAERKTWHNPTINYGKDTKEKV